MEHGNRRVAYVLRTYPELSETFVVREVEGLAASGVPVTVLSAFPPVHPRTGAPPAEILAHRGIRVQAWLRSASIRYTKPAKTALVIEFEVGDADVEDAVAALAREGRFGRSHHVVARDAAGVVCAEADTEVYLRLPREGQKEVSAF